MISRLANDQQFRELVRAVVAYLEDPEHWQQEVEDIVRRSIPAKDVNRFRNEILRRNPGMKSLADYFDVVSPRNRNQLEKMVQSIYSGIFDPTRPLGAPLKDHPADAPFEPSDKPMTPLQEQIRKLQEENREIAEYGKQYDILQNVRKNRPPIPRTACLSVINAFLDSLE